MPQRLKVTDTVGHPTERDPGARRGVRTGDGAAPGVLTNLGRSRRRGAGDGDARQVMETWCRAQRRRAGDRDVGQVMETSGR